MSRSNIRTNGIPDKCKLIKGQKPLINYRFYLDIEKHHISSKIETKIKELGGVSIYFIDCHCIIFMHKTIFLKRMPVN